jgi:hypothetical protein
MGGPVSAVRNIQLRLFQQISKRGTLDSLPDGATSYSLKMDQDSVNQLNLPYDFGK